MSTPKLAPLSCFRCVQGTDQPFTIPHDNGGNPSMPAVPDPRSHFNPIINGIFYAPVAGWYDFNTSAEIQESGMLLLQLESQRDGIAYTNKCVDPSGNCLVQLSCRLYLDADQAVRRLLAYYGAADAHIFQRPGTNYFEATYLGA